MKTPEEIIADTKRPNHRPAMFVGQPLADAIVQSLDAAGYEIRRKDRIADERAGPVLAAVRNLFDLSSSWSMTDIKDGVADAGVAAEPKEVYNAVGYLTRHGVIRRTNYGTYVKQP